MSTDSDDLDEDELLQMALKEQSQRDVNYQRPPPPSASGDPSKVVNFVQPSQQKARVPPQKGAGRGMMLQQEKHKNRRPVEEDDDSEVEMLSISSGDEDIGEERGAVAAAKGRGGSRGAREDDRGWDGEEPDCWKRVDEAELARRVRGMRETRTAPVTQKFEKKPSVVIRKGLNNLQSFPRGMECIDPLGLGIIDNRSLRLITESSESYPLKSDKDYLDDDLREKLIYFSEKFDAKLFLSRIHQDTSAADLEGGALALKTDLKGRTQQRKQLVKDNFDCFVSCKTTIDDIESKLKRIEEDPEGSGTSHLFNLMQGVSSLANRAFQPLFERQTQTEKIRSVQGMLQRFRTLFNLPSTIRGSISKGEYDLAVREYKKAKSIALPSHVNILKRVLEEVEKVMHEFKGTLYKSMEDPQIDLTSLENTVRLLLELEPESDPVWHYLNVQNQRIRGLLEKCTLDHEARMESLHNEMRERAISDARWRQMLKNLNQSSDINNSLSLRNVNLPVDAEPIDLTGEEVDALRGKYIRRLTAVLVHHIPAFWKVALSVFSGKFAKEKVGDAKYSSHSLDEVAGMIRTTISAYEVKVQNTFRDLEESNILRSYMSDAIKEISRACEAFEVKESAPPTAVMALRALQAETTKIYILRLCSWMRGSSEEISKAETWVPVSILERNRSPYTISYLPLAFRSIMASAMDQINLMIQSLRGEATKSEDLFAQLQEIQESVRLAFLNCFLDFAGHLEHIGSELAQSKSMKDISHVQNGYSHETEDKLWSDLPGSIVDSHQQLLIVLSNIGYCKEELCHELYNKYKNIWLQSREKDDEDSDMQDLVMSFSGLEEKVLAQYTFAKANLIRTAAMNYLFDSGVQWGAAPTVKGVRDAAVELLHTLVAVHAEVFAGAKPLFCYLIILSVTRKIIFFFFKNEVISSLQVFAGAKPLLDKTLSILVEGLIDTFLNLFHEYESKDLRLLDANGFCQLMLELEYFETILNPYFTDDARESLKSLQGLLLEKATESVTEAVENPGHHRRPTRGSEDALADERQQGMTVSPDDLIALAQQYSSELLEAELERTRINTACFEESMPLDSVPESAKVAYASFRGSVDSPSRNYRGMQAVGSPSFSRHKRR
ncbi:exocyst complex component SEC5A-like isoform X2 [Tripterygium wilfordii]|uniref:exocyst complex component SEC5A-like isoform X2 n=1 Tax=Tripterygium wilfordii TaxID=458696 RepID=UPI0018F7F51F|nr:exocyst complex component SEC5A-like isoform X2 [Tripterygium wilfordii]